MAATAEAERRRAEEEALRQRTAAEASRRQAEEEARRLQEGQARIQAAEEARRRAEEAHRDEARRQEAAEQKRPEEDAQRQAEEEDVLPAAFAALRMNELEGFVPEPRATEPNTTNTRGSGSNRGVPEWPADSDDVLDLEAGAVFETPETKRTAGPPDEISEFEDTAEIPTESLPADIESSAVAAERDEPIQEGVYVPSWSLPTPEAPTKRRAPWMVAGGAVVLSLVILLIVGVSLSGERKTKESPPPKESPTSAAPASMVYVQGGGFLMGSDAGDEYEKPAHKVTVKPFFIDTNEVTSEEYEKFVKATGHKSPPKWVNGTYPAGSARRPVTEVDWYDATAYAEWAKKRLPTEEEWEFAARGTDGRKYPWGGEWRANGANAGDSTASHTVDVGSYPDGKNPFGLMDLVGNAWEWTASDLKAYPNGQLPPHSPGEYKIIRGGSWKEDKNQATVTYRGYLLARGAKDYGATGFRCVADATGLPSQK